MNKLNKSLVVLGQLFGLLSGSGLRTPAEITIKNYPDYRILR